MKNTAILVCFFILCINNVHAESKTPNEKAKPGEVFLSLSPRAASAGALGAIIRFRITIPNPSPEMFCPSIEVNVWGEPLCDFMTSICETHPRDIPLFHAVSESDCPPWQEQPEIIKGELYPSSHDFPFAWPISGEKRIRLGPGTWEFEFIVKQGTKWITLREKVSVLN